MNNMSINAIDMTSAGKMSSTVEMTGNAFCFGTGMVHYMDGFHVTLQGGAPCLNLFLTSWTLDTPGKFVGAMIGILCLGMFVEGTSKIRQVCLDRARKYGVQKCNVHALRTLLTALRGFQAFVGYLLMLAAMTFSLEMLIMVVMGLLAGYGLFFQTDKHYLQVQDTAQEDAILSCDFMVEKSGPVVKRTLPNGNQKKAPSSAALRCSSCDFGVEHSSTFNLYAGGAPAMETSAPSSNSSSTSSSTVANNNPSSTVENIEV